MGFRAGLLLFIAAAFVACSSQPIAPLSCGEGTHLDGSVCVAAPPREKACGPGTEVVGNACVLGPVPVDPVCGAGTRLSGLTCVPLVKPSDGGPHEPSCGPGTIAQHGQCMRIGTSIGTYELRIVQTTVPGDGHSAVSVLAIGRRSNGSPARDRVIFFPDRPDAGEFSPIGVTLTPGGTATVFTPCNATANPACAGPVRLVMALALQPATLIASVDLTVTTPPAVGTAAPCRIGGPVLFFDGDPLDRIHPGQATITRARWSAAATSTSVSVRVDPDDPAEGLGWTLSFGSDALAPPLEAAVYEGAEKASEASPGHPGLEIGGDGRACASVTGRFQIEELARSGSEVVSFTATFEQHCDGALPVLRGCVHVELGEPQ